eukprot:scaffold31391_cov75-Cyclotella_meneghiniana.AAC.5
MENADGVPVGVNKLIVAYCFGILGQVEAGTFPFLDCRDGALRRHPPHSKKRVFIESPDHK